MAFLDITQDDAELQAALDAVEDSGLAAGGLLFTGANPTILGGDSDGSIILSAAAAGTGGNAAFYGPTHGTKAGDIEFRNTTSIKGGWDESADKWDFQANALDVGALTITGDTNSDDIFVGDGDGIIVGASAGIVVDSVSPEMQLLGTGSADSRIALSRFSADTAAAQFNFVKSRAVSIGSLATIVSGDELSRFTFWADDGTDFNTKGAEIRVASEGTIAGNRIPTNIKLLTGTDAGPSVVTTALTLDSAQLATFAAGITLASGVVTLPNGAVGAPSLVWVGSLTAGLFQSGADIINIANAGVETMEFSATNTIAVGKASSATVTVDIQGKGTETVLSIRNSAATAFFGSGQADQTLATGANAADHALIVNDDNVTGRSINASGTLNASGADYAEYEFKALGCGDIAKGDIIGFNIDGLLTDKFSEAVSFAIKSSDPAYVGGDRWGTEVEIGARPEKPTVVDPGFPDVPKPRELYDEPTLDTEEPIDPGAAPLVNKIRLPEETDISYEARQQAEATTLALWAAEKAQYDRDQPVYLANLTRFTDQHAAWEAAEVIWSIAMTDYNAGMTEYEQTLSDLQTAVDAAMPGYETALAAWKTSLETARQSVDRIAYSGKVPCNIIGGAVGDYVIPKAEPDDSISGLAVAAPTMAQYRQRVGQIKRWGVGGQAIVTVAMG